MKMKIMTQIKTNLLLSLLLILVLPACTFGQTKDNAKLMVIAREIIDAAGNCALITLDEEGRPRARTMDPFNPEDDFTIWFGTNRKSRKVVQINNDPRVTLYYFDKTSASYVTIHGKAIVLDDEKIKARHWKKKWAAFYPDYPNGYSLIKVTPEWLEVISESRGISGDSITWQPPTVKFQTKKL